MADISMIRGDDTYIMLIPTIDGEFQLLSEGDVLRLRVFDGSGDVIISKTATAADQNRETGEVCVKIAAADTQGLDIDKTQEFIWEAELHIAINGDYYTPFWDRTLEIRPDRITPETR